MILVINSSDKSVYVGVYRDGSEHSAKSWEAHRELSVQLNTVIDELVEDRDTLKGIIVYKGPGSYTGLRIGFSVANALGYAHDIPVVAVDGGRWIEAGHEELTRKTKFESVTPEYGGEVYTTKPVK